MPEISALLNTVVKAASKGSLLEHTLVFITMLMSRSPEVEFNIRRNYKKFPKLLTLPEK